MKNVTSKPQTSHPAIESNSHLFDDWFDPIENMIRGQVRGLIEEMIRGELCGVQSALRRLAVAHHSPAPQPALERREIGPAGERGAHDQFNASSMTSLAGHRYSGWLRIPPGGAAIAAGEHSGSSPSGDGAGGIFYNRP